MTRKAVWVAALVVLVANAAALASAWYNRSGGDGPELVLTEREARLLPRDSDNTAIGLRLHWIDPGADRSASTWFDAARLATLGFDCRLPVTTENRTNYMQPPRSAFAALEYQGENWTRYIGSIQPGPARDSAETGSHLVLVDVGLDPGVLRAAHPDMRRVVIVPATVELLFREPAGRPPFLAGRVSAIFPVELNVPKSFRSELEGLSVRPVTAPNPGQVWRGLPLARLPRYRVTVRWGRSLEPWLTGVTRMPPDISGKN